MTTQPETAVGSDAQQPAAEPTNPADVFTKLAEEEFGITDEQEEEQPVEGEESAEEADDEPDIEEEADDPPPIDAPVSWDAEAKAKFAELPRDTQEYIAKREGERERFVQSKSQEATRARQEAEQAAITQLAQIQANLAQEYQQFAGSLQVQKPDPMLQLSDPVAFAQQMQAFDRSEAQRSQAQQQAYFHAQQAQAHAQQVEQARNAEQHRIIVEQFPEYADPTTGPKLRAELSAVAKEMGYSDELIAQAKANDILAVKQAAAWREDATKYRNLMKNRMQGVRAAKGLPKVATPGVSQGTAQLSARSAQAALEVAKTSKDRNVQGAAFSDYLIKTGQMK